MAGDENAKGPERPSGSAGRLAALGAGLVLGAIAYSPLFLPAGEIDPLREAEEWFFLSSSSSAGIVLLLCAWLFYRRWSGLRALPGVSGFRAGPAIFLLLGVCLASWSYLTGAVDVLVLSLLANGVGLTLAFRGARGLRFTGFPLAVLVLALPLPGVVFNEVVFQFQLWTAQWAGWLLHHLGFVAFVQSDLIIRPEDTFEIVEGCSGIRSVEALTLLSILVVDSFHRRGLHAVIIVALAPAVAFLMNGFRVLTLIFNPDSDVVAIHNLQGVLILLAGLVLMVLIDGLLERLIAAKTHSRRESEAEGSAAGGDRSALAALLVTFGACAFASLVLVPAWAPASLPAALRVRLVEGLESWSWTPIKIDQAYLGQTNFRESLEGSFYRDGEVVDVFLGVGDPRKRDRSFVTPKTAFPGSGWVVLRRRQEFDSPPSGYPWSGGSYGRGPVVFSAIERIGVSIALRRKPWSRSPGWTRARFGRLPAGTAWSPGSRHPSGGPERQVSRQPEVAWTISRPN